MPTVLKCACLHCGGHIEFDADAAGQEISCPHCGKQTWVDDPARFSYAKPAGEKIPLRTMAAPKPKKLVEDSLDAYANGAVILGVIIFVIQCVAAAMTFLKFENEDAMGLQVICAFGTLCGAFFFKTLLNALAEIIRLLRRSRRE